MRSISAVFIESKQIVDAADVTGQAASVCCRMCPTPPVAHPLQEGSSRVTNWTPQCGNDPIVGESIVARGSSGYSHVKEMIVRSAASEMRRIKHGWPYSTARLHHHHQQRLALASATATA